MDEKRYCKTLSLPALVYFVTGDILWVVYLVSKMENAAGIFSVFARGCNYRYRDVLLMVHDLTLLSHNSFISIIMTTAIVTLDAAMGGEMVPGEIMRFDDMGCPIIVLEIKCQRFACSKEATNWLLYPVAAAPLEFVKYLDGKETKDSFPSRGLLRAVFGENNMQLPRTSVGEILARQMVHPFYIFQYFSVAVW